MRNFFVNKENSSVMCTIDSVDDNGYVKAHVVWPDKGQRWAMPVEEYDKRFATMWRPATLQDIDRMIPESFRAPANTDDWDLVEPDEV